MCIFGYDKYWEISFVVSFKKIKEKREFFRSNCLLDCFLEENYWDLLYSKGFGV